MNDERLRDAYRRGLPAHDDAGPLDDVSAERLRRLVEQEGSETERLRTLDLALATDRWPPRARHRVGRGARGSSAATLDGDTTRSRRRW